jgi:peptide/nickel transport system permease protein
MRLLRFTARRLLLLLPVLLGVTIVTFLLVRVLPGDPVRTILGPNATPDDVEAARHRLGLDESLPVQYWHYLSGLVRGDFGTSIQSGRAVSHEMALRIGATLELVAIGLGVALVVAVVLGIACALRPNRLGDHVVRVGSLVGNAMPEFWLGLVLILVVYNYLRWAPVPSGRVDPDTNLTPLTGADLVDAVVTGNAPAVASSLAHLALPALTLAIVVCASLLRSVRSSALEVRASPAFVAATAHGIPSRRLVTRYLARPALVRLPTLAALVFGNLLGSTVLVEYVFSWQGLGQWALSGLQYRDYPVVQAAVFVIAFAYVVVFLVADVVHAALDPRVRL